MIRTFSLLLALPIAFAASANWSGYSTGLSSIRSITTVNDAIYVASYPTGVHKSTDEGQSWVPVNTGIPVSSGNIFVQSVGRRGTDLFAGTQSGIYRSTNGGTSWTLANTGPSGALTASGTVHANKFFTFGNTTYAVFQGLISAGGGMYRYNPGNNTWLLGHSGMSTNMRVYHLAYDDQHVYAGTNIGIYRSTDGQQWEAFGQNVNFDIYGIQKVGNRFHIICAGGYKYSDNGTTWINATGGIAAPTKGELISYNGNLYALTGTNQGCLISTNNGVSYTAFNTGIEPIDVISNEEFHASPTMLYMGALQDLYGLPGSSVGAANSFATPLPPVFPTAFTDGFTVDLSGQEVNLTITLIDATGREVRRESGLRAGMVRIERGTLVAGRYHCLLIDPVTGVLRPLGQVIAQ